MLSPMSKPATCPRKLKLMATVCFSPQPRNHIAVEKEPEPYDDNDNNELGEDAEHAFISIEGRPYLTGVNFLHRVPLRE